MANDCMYIYIHIKKNIKNKSLGFIRSKLQGKWTPIMHHNLTPYFREGLYGICLKSNQNDLSIKFNHFRIGSFTPFSERKLSAKFYPNIWGRSRQQQIKMLDIFWSEKFIWALR